MAKDSSYTTKEEQLARIAKAMGHPARIAILNFLARRDSCYFGAIHEELPIAKATVSQHLKELKDAGLIQGEIEAPRMKYCICRPNWKMAQVLMNELLNQGSEQKKRVLRLATPYIYTNRITKPERM
jgi:DNA-binding transcriptional ArsR family regulator